MTCLDMALLLWLSSCCQVFKVEPAFALAVMANESAFKIELNTKRYVGLYCLHKGYMKERHRIQPETAQDPYINIYYGVRALRGKDKMAVMKRFNTEIKQDYIKGVLRCYAKYKKEGMNELRE